LQIDISFVCFKKSYSFTHSQLYVLILFYLIEELQSMSQERNRGYSVRALPSQPLPSPPLPRGRVLSDAIATRPPPPVPTPPSAYAEFVWGLVRDVFALLGITESSPIYESVLQELNRHARIYPGNFAMHVIERIVTKCQDYRRAHTDVVAAIVIQKYIRTLRAYNDFIHLRDPTLNARRAVLAALIADERNYVHKLSVIVSDYLRPLREHVQGKNRPKNQSALLSLQDLQAIFGNIDSLLLLHTELLRDLDHLMRPDRLEAKDVNKLFVMTAPKLRQLYTTYINNYTRSFTTLQRLRDTSNSRNPTYNFESFLSNLQFNSRMPDVSLSYYFFSILVFSSLFSSLLFSSLFFSFFIVLVSRIF
jgi:hypothetical protein